MSNFSSIFPFPSPAFQGNTAPDCCAWKKSLLVSRTTLQMPAYLPPLAFRGVLWMGAGGIFARVGWISASFFLEIEKTERLS